MENKLEEFIKNNIGKLGPDERTKLAFYSVKKIYPVFENMVNNKDLAYCLAQPYIFFDHIVLYLNKENVEDEKLHITQLYKQAIERCGYLVAAFNYGDSLYRDFMMIQFYMVSSHDDRSCNHFIEALISSVLSFIFKNTNDKSKVDEALKDIIEYGTKLCTINKSDVQGEISPPTVNNLTPVKKMT